MVGTAKVQKQQQSRFPHISELQPLVANEEYVVCDR